MNIQEIEIIFANEKLTLNNQRSIFWKRKKMLVLSDLHLGKAAHFRKSGIAIPKLVTVDDLNRLENLLIHYSPEEFVIVGDLVHADTNREVNLFNILASKFPAIRIVLVRGNHDRLSNEQSVAMGINEVLNVFQADPISFSHSSVTGLNGYWIVGHIHPGIRIELPTKRFIRLPCFVVTDTQIVLPAFSRFTGLDIQYTPKEATYFVFDEKDIFKLEHF